MAVEARAPTILKVGKYSWEIRRILVLEGKSVEDLKASDEAWNDYNDKRGFTGGYIIGGRVLEQFFANRFSSLNVTYNTVEEYGESLDDRFWNRASQPRNSAY